MVVRSFTVMVQRGGDHPVDILLIGYVGGSIISLLVPTSLGSICLWVTYISHLVEVSISAKQLKDVSLCIPWGVARTLPQGCTIVFWLFLPSLHIFSLLWLAIAWSALWNSGKVMEAEWCLFPVIKIKGTQKGFCAQNPCRVLLSGNASSRSPAGYLLAPHCGGWSALRSLLRFCFYSTSALTTALPCSPQITWWDSYFDVCGSLSLLLGHILEGPPLLSLPPRMDPNPAQSRCFMHSWWFSLVVTLVSSHLWSPNKPCTSV